jgi:hypothetical protein
MLDGRRDVMKKWLEKLMRPERSATITLHPTPALAQDAAMSLLDYADRKNCPGGEVITSPVEDAVDGFIRFSYPVLHQGREIRAAPRRARHRHEPRRHPVHRERSLRREDRRDVPPGRRPRLRQPGQPQRVGDPHRHGLRPENGQPALRRREGLLPGRGVHDL